MCGIAGIFNRASRRPAQPELLAAMLAAIRHRGPEAAGAYLHGVVGLGHDRLSIVDLEGGLQPIGNEDGTVWVICNGEVFNFIELRRDLIERGHTFRTGSDSEVIIHLYEEHGPDCVQYMIGQFAFALWDGRTHTLMLGRDRLGVRPLYYTEVNGDLRFASEVKALLADPQVPAELDLEALDQVFTYWAPLPGRTAFRGIRELPPGHHMLVGLHGTPTSACVRRYWSLDFSHEFAGRSKGYDERYYAHSLLDLLVDATRLRLRADVPVGAYLSGGLDSSTIAAIVRRYTGNRLKTFSISFADEHFDEAAYQQRMADHLGTEHVSMHCTDEQIGQCFPDVVWHVETPILRTAPVPMFLLSRLVRQNGFKVVLTGEGSDEFLGGYDIFKEDKLRRFWAAHPGSRLRPLLLKRLYGDVKGMADTPRPYLEAFFRNGLTETADPCYSHLVRWRSTARIKRLFSRGVKEQLAEAGHGGARALAEALEGIDMRWHPLSRAQFIESRIFLSQYLLSSQGDRVAMAHAVEGRFPFLDHRVVEFAASIPPDLRLRGLTEKYILRKAVADLVPDEVLARTKRPYRAPIRNAFFGPRSPDYVRHLLSPTEVRRTGIFDPEAVAMLAAKCSTASMVGEADSMALVGVLSTQLLYQLFVEQRRATRPPDDFRVTRVAAPPPAESERRHEHAQVALPA
jgi:asparagine synthase (glutamine-hydrolysing)